MSEDLSLRELALENLTKPPGYAEALQSVRAVLRGRFDYQEKYSDILYPRGALSLLALSRTDEWPLFEPIDGLLSWFLLHWLDHNVVSPQSYARQLFGVLDDLDITDGAFLRLNLEILRPDAADEITVLGRAVKQTSLRHSMPPAAKARAKRFLHQQEAFLLEIDEVQAKLAARTGEPLEHTILSWLGYLVLRATAERLAEQRLTSVAGLLKRQC